jgi:hypothetical protein
LGEDEAESERESEGSVGVAVEVGLAVGDAETLEVGEGCEVGVSEAEAGMIRKRRKFDLGKMEMVGDASSETAGEGGELVLAVAVKVWVVLLVAESDGGSVGVIVWEAVSVLVEEGVSDRVEVAEREVLVVSEDEGSTVDDSLIEGVNEEDGVSDPVSGAVWVDVVEGVSLREIEFETEGVPVKVLDFERVLVGVPVSL